MKKKETPNTSKVNDSSGTSKSESSSLKSFLQDNFQKKKVSDALREQIMQKIKLNSR